MSVISAMKKAKTIGGSAREEYRSRPVVFLRDS
jgi:hypothetical protein